MPLDALIIFNLLNNPGTLIDASGRLPVARPADSDLPFYDTSGDGFCTSLDALLIINELNNQPRGESEGEFAPPAPPTPAVPPAQLSGALEIALSDIASDVWLSRQRRKSAGPRSF